MSAPVVLPSRARIAASFGLKSDRYAENATFQIELLNRVARLVGTAEPTHELWADWGCGIGLLERIIVRQGRCAPYLVGIDLARRAAVRAAASYGLVAVADIDRNPFKPRRFDGVVLASVLQWVGRPALVLKGVREVLRDGGRAVLSVFLKGSYIEVSAARKALGLEPIGWYPSLPELTHLIER